MPDIDKEIQKSIESGQYNSVGSGGGYDYNKCNLFLDDMLQEHWGVKLPRIKHGAVFKTDLNWPENPMRASTLGGYLRNRKEVPGSGVIQVTPEIGKELTDAGNLVIAIDALHATIMAQSENPWPLIYRSDLSFRGEDKRNKVGVKPESYLKFFYIDPKLYNKFNEDLKDSGESESQFVPWAIRND